MAYSTVIENYDDSRGRDRGGRGGRGGRGRGRDGRGRGGHSHPGRHGTPANQNNDLVDSHNIQHENKN